MKMTQAIVNEMRRRIQGTYNINRNRERYDADKFAEFKTLRNNLISFKVLNYKASKGVTTLPDNFETEVKETCKQFDKAVRELTGYGIPSC